jgi:hypothetical protein
MIGQLSTMAALTELEEECPFLSPTITCQDEMSAGLESPLENAPVDALGLGDTTRDQVRCLLTPRLNFIGHNTTN